MITADLISYIKKQKEKNIPKTLIFSKLLKAGWLEEDINEGFEKVDRDEKQKSSISIPEQEIIPKDTASTNDKYREPFEGDPLAKTEIPVFVKPVLNTTVEPEKPNLVIPETKTEIVVENTLPQVNKEEVISSENFVSEVQKEPEQSIVVQDLELPKGFEEKVVNEKNQPENIFSKEVSLLDLGVVLKEDNREEVKKDYSNVLIPKTVPVKQAEEPAFVLEKKEEIKIEPKEIILPQTETKEEVVGAFGNTNIVLNNSLELSEIKNAAEETKKDYSMDNLPKIASMNTLSQDLQKIQAEGVSTVNTEERKAKIFTVLKWAFGVLVLAGLGFGGFMVYKGDIRLNIPFIKKDPRVLILENSKILSSLKSYKSDTTVLISTPSIASLTASLMSGEENKSIDKDTISIDSMGKVNQDGDMFMSENNVLIKSTVLQNFIKTDIRNDGQNLYVNIPDLTYLLKEKAPYSSVVKMNEQESMSVSKMFEGELGLFLGRLNIYQLLAKGVSSFIDKNTIGSYEDLISKVEITEKGVDSIKGVDTYRYSINPDKELFKKLLVNITDKFILNQNEEDRIKMTEIVSSAFVKSFDVWVGKSDNTIYQYEIVLDIPLSKILSFEDKSIGDNQVSISWKTTYHDFNERNEIIIPDSFISTKDFIKNTKVKTIKEQVNALPALSDDLRKIEKTFGLRSNTTGSCMSPVSGSLFSPVGHLKTATIPVGQISSALNNILSLTSGQGICFSDLKSWSMTVPLSEDYTAGNPFDSYYCVDSTGMRKEVSVPTKGPVCE